MPVFFDISLQHARLLIRRERYHGDAALAVVDRHGKGAVDAEFLGFAKEKPLFRGGVRIQRLSVPKKWQQTRPRFSHHGIDVLVAPVQIVVRPLCGIGGNVYWRVRARARETEIGELGEAKSLGEARHGTAQGNTATGTVKPIDKGLKNK